MWASVLVFFVAMLGGSLSAVILAPKLRAAGIVGKDLHKPLQPEIPEMGGLALIAGFTLAILFAIGLEAFLPKILPVDFVLLLAVLATVLLTGLVGILDDLLGLRQAVKAFLPVIAALPLVAVRAGHTTITIPFLGRVNFGLVYSLLLVPLGITGAANAVNMLAGFNGLELGMSLVAMATLSAIAAKLGATTALVILLAGGGAALGLLPLNWYPAKIFVGDVGTLSLGAILASSCIVGDFEAAGLVLIMPYALDFLIKAAHGFPSRGWAGELGKDGKLRCPKNGPVGLAQAILKIHPLSERGLVLVLMGIEAIFAGLALFLYYVRR
jgi:UDP-N-acetylglucosamine--dolichyl-phosphate N-acetylglucosaminephosphotransferase